MRPWPTAVQLVVLGAWFGAAVLFAAVVAPAAFAVLPTRALAGALVGRVLPAVFYAGIAVGVVVIAAGTVGAGSRSRPLLARGAGTVILVSCAIGQLWVGPRIEKVRQSIPGAVEALSPDDPRRIAFGRLHALSVGWLALAMLAAAAALVLIARGIPSRS